MKKYRHLFFDLDGTLWDLHRNTLQALDILFHKYEAELNHLNINEFAKGYFYHNELVWELYRQGKIEKSLLRTIRFKRAFEDVDHFPNDRWIETFADDFLTVCPIQPHTVHGTEELLLFLKEKSCKLHIITNGFIEVQGHKMKAAGLDNFFEQVVNSEDAGARKPSSQIFEYALHKAGAEVEHSLMIGDDWDADVLGARDFGMDQVFVTSTEDLLKADRTNRNLPEPRHNYKPTFTVQNMAALLDLIQKHNLVE